VFTVPAEWKGLDVFIRFEAVKSAFYIWVNGRKVGYSQDSKTPAEWRITPYLKDGENVVALEVYRWSDGSYLECQDMWRISGIERDVYLYAAPEVRIRDFFVVAGLDDNYENGKFALNVEIGNGVPGLEAGAYGLVYSLHDAEGRTVLSEGQPLDLKGKATASPGSKGPSPVPKNGRPKRRTFIPWPSSSGTRTAGRSRAPPAGSASGPSRSRTAASSSTARSSGSRASTATSTTPSRPT